MSKMYFAKTVKYLGVTYPPNTKFEVLDEEIEDLKAVGGWVVENKKADEEAEEVEELSELELLRQEAGAMGIEYRGNWGVKKLAAAIAEAEQA